MAELVARGRAFYAGTWKGLAIQPRFHSLLVAPTGTGKTAVATMAATELSATLMRIAAPNWMPSGSKSSTQETIAVIAAAVAINERTFLVVDEIDKLNAGIGSVTGSGSGGSHWQVYCRGELFDLLDGRWPTGLKLPEHDDENPLITLEQLTEKLQTTVFVLGIGTFQDFFDDTGCRRPMGFGAENSPADDELTAEEIAERLPRELANRFNSALIRLPELTGEHYHRIARQAADSLPERMRQAFAESVTARIAGAIGAKKGVRFLEEAMMEVLKSLPSEQLKIPDQQPQTYPESETKKTAPFPCI